MCGREHMTEHGQTFNGQRCVAAAWWSRADRSVKRSIGNVGAIKAGLTVTHAPYLISASSRCELYRHDIALPQHPSSNSGCVSEPFHPRAWAADDQLSILSEALDVQFSVASKLCAPWQSAFELSSARSDSDGAYAPRQDTSGRTFDTHDPSQDMETLSRPKVSEPGRGQWGAELLHRRGGATPTRSRRPISATTHSVAPLFKEYQCPKPV